MTEISLTGTLSINLTKITRNVQYVNLCKVVHSGFIFYTFQEVVHL